jgi:cation transport ATPase
MVMNLLVWNSIVDRLCTQKTKKGEMIMKTGITLFFLVALILVAFTGAAVALEMSGKVTAVDAAKGTLKIQNETIDTGFDCETGSMIKDVKVGDQVKVEYSEVGGKKKATKVTPAAAKKKAAIGC